MRKQFADAWRVLGRGQKIGMAVCLTGAMCCLSVGLLGVLMILYWHHMTNNWLDDHVFFWMEVGLPTTIGAFMFTRTMDLFH